jgi:hypothetical protein
MNSLQHTVRRLIADSVPVWETARKNYAALRNIRRKTVDFTDFRIEVQFNPDRIHSTTAPLDPGARPCFLCAANRPPEQQAVRWRGYEVLVNPFPIFDPHLVVASGAHVPQFLTGKIGDMLALASDLPDFAVTFNGARAGASAPDHFHFQAVEKSILPSISELTKWKNRHTLYNKSTGLPVWAADGYLRPAIVVGGANADATAQMAERVLTLLKEILHEPDEAQVNALAWHGSGRYTVVFFPRTAHRPREYDAPEGTRFLFSPGAAELAGVVVTVREEDFQRADAPLLMRLFSQVVPDKMLWKSIKNEISRWLTANPK